MCIDFKTSIHFLINRYEKHMRSIACQHRTEVIEMTTKKVKSRVSVLRTVVVLGSGM